MRSSTEGGHSAASPLFWKVRKSQFPYICLSTPRGDLKETPTLRKQKCGKRSKVVRATCETTCSPVSKLELKSDPRAGRANPGDPNLDCITVSIFVPSGARFQARDLRFVKCHPWRR
ncbi:hypothetical protein L596_016414 [Steinernema carpocapsae]|uniref:Uncharacterized protein n=1 Tax=Steinernema carpocapsae TaxID=34508 RepID=A0A4U5NIZ1_STECR|nr:hypothetical protein L596_016414 [Steinernema carpocapsae]